jgi:hypothetical protein
MIRVLKLYNDNHSQDRMKPLMLTVYVFQNKLVRRTDYRERNVSMRTLLLSGYFK